MTAERDRLVDAAALYSLDPHAESSELTFAAAEALASGIDSPALRELAGLSSNTCRQDVDWVAAQAFEQLGLVFPEAQSSAAQLGVLRALCERFAAGGGVARELTSWAHTHIGHAGADIAQDLVALDDDLDVIEITGYSVDGRSPREVADELDAAVAAFLASYPRE